MVPPCPNPQVIEDIDPPCQILTQVLNLCPFNVLLLWQGYGGGDEVNMLRRHLLGTPTKFGVGANRTAVASSFIQKYGYIDIRNSNHEQKAQNSLDSEKIGVVILDDAMQVTNSPPHYPYLFSHVLIYCFTIYFLITVRTTTSV